MKRRERRRRDGGPLPSRPLRGKGRAVAAPRGCKRRVACGCCQNKWRYARGNEAAPARHRACPGRAGALELIASQLNITGCCMYWRHSPTKLARCRQHTQPPLCLAPRRAGVRGQPGRGSGGSPRAEHHKQCGHGLAITANIEVRRFARSSRNKAHPPRAGQMRALPPCIAAALRAARPGLLCVPSLFMGEGAPAPSGCKGQALRYATGASRP
jgi:hypothetical protein